MPYLQFAHLNLPLNAVMSALLRVKLFYSLSLFSLTFYASLINNSFKLMDAVLTEAMRQVLFVFNNCCFCAYQDYGVSWPLPWLPRSPSHPIQSNILHAGGFRQDRDCKLKVEARRKQIHGYCIADFAKKIQQHFYMNIRQHWQAALNKSF